MAITDQAFYLIVLIWIVCTVISFRMKNMAALALAAFMTIAVGLGYLALTQAG